MLSRDRRALEGLPLRLLITSMVLAMSVPALYGSLAYLDRATSVQRATEVAEDIKAAASSAFVGGPGNIRSLDLDMGSSRMVSLRIGAGACRLIEVLWDDEVASTIKLERPDFRMSGHNGRQIVVDGSFSILLRCERSEGVQLITVEVV